MKTAAGCGCSAMPGFLSVNNMYKLVFFVPPEHLEQVKEAVFAAGAGRIGDYSNCCWQAPGEGQFKPLAGSRPFTGQQDVTETVAEYRVEMVCEDTLIDEVVKALLAAHPYEEPAYDVWRLAEL